MVEISTGVIKERDGKVFAVDDYDQVETELDDGWLDYVGRKVRIEYGQIASEVSVELQD